MNVYRIYLFIDLFDVTPLLIFLFLTKRGEHCFVFTLTPLLMIDKKGEKYFSIYACFPCFIHKGGEGFMFMHICFILQKGEENLMSFMLDWHVYLLTFAYIFI